MISVVVRAQCRVDIEAGNAHMSVLVPHYASARFPWQIPGEAHAPDPWGVPLASKGGAHDGAGGAV